MLQIERLQSGADSMTEDWWRLLIGDPAKDQKEIEAVSPALQADKFTAPVLLIHGANDTVVPIEHSERIEAALRGAGKQVEFIRFPGEDHWLSERETRIALLRELERFLKAHIGPDAEADSR